MELNLNKPTPSPENEALTAILQLELELRKALEESATDEAEERAEKLKAIFGEQISALDKILNWAELPFRSGETDQSKQQEMP